ncbi:tripartite tricarboxylate transporter substrate binding protein [Pseudomonas daroniae]|uniref:Tripartite tricarboxylate transporter substrate binding protein n=1 Tax=Phytopseudomonas daroniae TaxID=2487519 RepID=A0A4Q9QI07_9GAMM|nr:MULTISPECIES: tripartite tricarboxylate transporter substrate binding protein [Pseudomonas]TBU73413.1 tripartite tricarboxylate transporter substrate binding protein [Pseudomonas daroniae]TBU74511.1 tripartite tricarboxylate transporter substrate binding protein [Pseudomonas daroniae]TBU79165.1 tripartite tricarboxylate transporter substrate binding protein [Pseudomonas sp. FRB 228]TBU88063.1 tripartite tricarboxylate transporter substrate binding protein [Pseudomonas daroniae]
MLKALCASAAIALGTLTLSVHADYPERSIQAVIPWGAGGGTDSVMRSLAPHVEKELGGKLILNNRPGGTGVVGSTYVLQQRPNGYTLLLGAENPQLYPVLGLAKFDYSDFYPVNIIGQNVAVIVTHADAPWNSMAELLAEAKTNPGTLRMGGTGAGGIPSTVHAMINAVGELKVREVTFAGDGPSVTALLGKHIDFTPLSLAASKEMIRTGKLKGLAVIATQEVPDLPGVEPITESLPEIAEYLPWGSFWGAFVHKDTPDEIKQKLTDAYAKAVASEEFQQFLKNFGGHSLNLSGVEAESYLKRWQSVTAWSMYKAEAISIAPDSVGIARP